MTYGARSKTCFKIERLSWGQHIVLSAAVQVDYLPLESWLQISLTHGVWRSLIIRGLLRPCHNGWEATQLGKKVIGNDRFIITPQKEKLTMDGKSPRYSVSRTYTGWAVIDRSLTKVTKTKINDDVVEMLKTRNAARARANELNLLDMREKHTEGDAA
jgi:hypothetical protein